MSERYRYLVEWLAFAKLADDILPNQLGCDKKRIDRFAHLIEDLGMDDVDANNIAADLSDQMHLPDNFDSDAVLACLTVSDLVRAAADSYLAALRAEAA